MEPRGSGASSQRNMRREGIQQVLEQGLWRLTTDWMQGPREMTATIRQTLGSWIMDLRQPASATILYTGKYPTDYVGP
ncbi:hypothetical protein VULLAG_LOCUS19277 [Vulpes lagopus]